MRTIKTVVYTFDELSEPAKQKALENLYDTNVDHNWWDYTYDDAETIGLKITEFDLEYILAENMLKEYAKIVESYPKDSDGELTIDQEYDMDKELDELEYQFEKDLLEVYSIILQKEYDYLTSNAAIIETIQSNGYEFTEGGELV